jgi:hypothetical protein
MLIFLNESALKELLPPVDVLFRYLTGHIFKLCYG